jgi:hypothetical protein
LEYWSQHHSHQPALLEPARQAVSCLYRIPFNYRSEKARDIRAHNRCWRGATGSCRSKHPACGGELVRGVCLAALDGTLARIDDKPATGGQGISLLAPCPKQATATSAGFRAAFADALIDFQTLRVMNSAVLENQQIGGGFPEMTSTQQGRTLQNREQLPCIAPDRTSQC